MACLPFCSSDNESTPAAGTRDRASGRPGWVLRRCCWAAGGLSGLAAGSCPGFALQHRVSQAFKPPQRGPGPGGHFSPALLAELSSVGGDPDVEIVAAPTCPLSAVKATTSARSARRARLQAALGHATRCKLPAARASVGPDKGRRVRFSLLVALASALGWPARMGQSV
ncbi:hypothetical protein K402DRAFT_32062 [Aulographum hederae CBS 113979]|uniref:Uncharacterized protein n=1 Tax=Aulographum hederae CBS 113979 TaxID=1176131 RepID=A0A6G1H534_9PEZI|nr:hypothetical protein K402DRAFT_32062 [Aulographum hederae CBS 113979]